MATQAEIEAAKELLSQWGHDVVASLSLSADYDIKKVAHAACVLSSISQQQPVNERLLEDVLTRIESKRDSLEELRHPDPFQQGQINALNQVTDILSEAIAAAKAEIDERRKPVTEEWLKEVGFQIITKKTSEQFACWKHSCVFDFPDGEASIDPDTVNARRAGQSPKTRGDVLDLLRVIGGAK